jgi:hypothetical protein
MVVDDVEGAGRRRPEGCLDVGEVDVLGVADAVRVAVAVRSRGHTGQPPRRRRVPGREQSHVVPTPDELLGQEMDDELGPAVAGRRYAFVGRSDLRDPDGAALLAGSRAPGGLVGAPGSGF